MNQSKTLVIFDIDGTLLYSNRVDSQCFADAYFDIYKKPFPSINWSNYPHVTDHNIFRYVIKEQFGRIAPLEEIEDFQAEFVLRLKEKRNQAPEEFNEIPGAKKAVNNLLDDDNYVIGIATGGWFQPAKIKLHHIGFNIEDMIVSCADGKETREDIIQVVLDCVLARQQISRTVYVGDAPWDVRTTRNMQMNFVGIRRNGDQEALLGMGASHVLNNYHNYDNFRDAIHNCTPPQKV